MIVDGDEGIKLEELDDCNAEFSKFTIEKVISKKPISRSNIEEEDDIHWILKDDDIAWYSFQSKYGKYLCAESDGKIVLSNNNDNKMIKFQFIHDRQNEVYHIKSYNGLYLSAQKNGTIVCDREKAKTWEQWEFCPASIKIHVYGIEQFSIYHTSIEFDGIEYYFYNDDTVNYGKPKMEHMKFLTTINKLISLSEEDIRSIIDNTKEKWNDQMCIYHSVNNNCNHFTKDVLDAIGHGANDIDNVGKKYFDNRELQKIERKYIESKSIMFNTMDQIMHFVKLQDKDYRKIKILQRCKINIPIQERSKWELAWKGFLAGTIFVVAQKAGINQDSVSKILLGIFWILPPFIAHFFNQNVQQFTPDIIIECHSFICLLMVMYSMYIISISWNKYQWKYSLLFAFILAMLGGIYYVCFYSFNIWVNIFCIITMPICWLRLYHIQVTVSETEKELNILYDDEYYGTVCDDELKKEVIQLVLDELKHIKGQKFWRQSMVSIFFIALCICFSFKIYGRFTYSNYKGWGMNYSNKLEVDCDNFDDDFVCLWMKNELKLPQYIHVLDFNGFDNMELVCTINEDNLRNMGIDKQGHINKILKYTKSNCAHDINEKVITDKESDFVEDEKGSEKMEL